MGASVEGMDSISDKCSLGWRSNQPDGTRYKFEDERLAELKNIPLSKPRRRTKKSK